MDDTEADLADKIQMAESLMRAAWAKGFTRAQAHLEQLLAHYRERLARLQAAKANG